MPAAIDRFTRVKASPRQDRVLKLHSLGFGETVEVSLDEAAPRGHWSDYVVGVAVTLEVPRGANLELEGNVPLGAGLSSSASVEVASALALTALNGITLSRPELALVCQRAENEFVGMRCGIMDQFICCCGQEGSALLLDCRSLEYRPVPIPSGVRVVIANTMVKHSLASSAYNERRAQCEEAAERLGVKSLRDAVSLDGLTGVILKRARHVVGENARVLEAGKALEAGDVARFGRLMGESHVSLRDDYEVSCTGLDKMVELCVAQPGVYGARMTGGGFGGCVVSLVSEESVAGFVDAVSRQYEESAGVKPEIYACVPSQGGVEEMVAADSPR
ncbi:MAG: galactokinase [Candidatus Xenobia bacterium]